MTLFESRIKRISTRTDVFWRLAQQTRGVRVQIEFFDDGDPVGGCVAAEEEDERSRPFSGWLQLLEILMSLTPKSGRPDLHR